MILILLNRDILLFYSLGLLHYNVLSLFNLKYLVSTLKCSIFAVELVNIVLIINFLNMSEKKLADPIPQEFLGEMKTEFVSVEETFFDKLLSWMANWDCYDYSKANFNEKEHVLQSLKEHCKDGTNGFIAWACNLDRHNREELKRIVEKHIML